MNDDELDALMLSGAGPAPAGFGERVMQTIAALPSSEPVSRWRTLAHRLVLVAAAAAGLSQALAFVFGLWVVTAAAAA